MYILTSTLRQLHYIRFSFEKLLLKMILTCKFVITVFFVKKTQMTWHKWQFIFMSLSVQYMPFFCWNVYHFRRARLYYTIKLIIMYPCTLNICCLLYSTICEYLILAHSSIMMNSPHTWRDQIKVVKVTILCN